MQREANLGDCVKQIQLAVCQLEKMKYQILQTHLLKMGRKISIVREMVPLDNPFFFLTQHCLYISTDVSIKA